VGNRHRADQPSVAGRVREGDAVATLDTARRVVTNRAWRPSVRQRARTSGSVVTTDSRVLADDQHGPLAFRQYDFGGPPEEMLTLLISAIATDDNDAVVERARGLD
jgi:hypothetical protein